MSKREWLRLAQYSFQNQLSLENRCALPVTGWHGAIGRFHYTGPVCQGYADLCVRPQVTPLCAPLP